VLLLSDRVASQGGGVPVGLSSCWFVIMGRSMDWSLVLFAMMAVVVVAGGIIIVRCCCCWQVLGNVRILLAGERAAGGIAPGCYSKDSFRAS
jgi:hypothetical protein